jgi:hypothetical protein
MVDSQHHPAVAVLCYGPRTNFVCLPKGHEVNCGFDAAEDFSSGIKRAEVLRA